MTDQEKTNPRRMNVEFEGVAPPPKLLLWLVVGLFVLFVLGAAGVFILSSGVSPTSLIRPGVIMLGLLVVGSVAGVVIFRKSLPRRFALWVIAGWALLAVIGGVAGILIYRNVLAPGQRETARFFFPLLVNFDPPPDPSDLTLPTPETVSSISPLDLLNTPLTIGTRAATEPVAEIEASATTAPTATSTPQATATGVEATPTEATEAAVVPTLTPEVTSNTASSRPPLHRLYGFVHVQQTWNNCGPANITIGLSYFGWSDSQDVAASYLKPDREDKNVNPSEMVAFVNEQTGVRAITRIGGDLDLLRDLLANDFPVIIETGYMYEGSDWLGHYQTVVGYDDLQQVVYLYDSYLGAGENGEGIAESYTSLDANWQAFNRTFIVLYRQEDEGRVAALLGDRADLTLAAEHALQVAQEEAQINPQNGYAWFNMGTAFTRLGQYEEAAVAFDQARRIGVPFRMSWYQFGPFEAYYSVGRYDEVLSLASVTINDSRGYVEEAYYWQGQALAAQGRSTEAAEAYRRALARNPAYSAAQEALDELNV